VLIISCVFGNAEHKGQGEQAAVIFPLWLGPSISAGNCTRVLLPPPPPPFHIRKVPKDLPAPHSKRSLKGREKRRIHFMNKVLPKMLEKVAHDTSKFVYFSDYMKQLSYYSLPSTFHHPQG
jgi:hypothetical protein